MTAKQYLALAEFRYAIANFLAFSSRAAQTVGLQPRQHQALLVVKGWQGESLVTIKHLAERLQMRHNSAVGLVDRLCRRGLLRRETDAADHRKVDLRLTAAGNAIIARLSRTHYAELRSLAPLLRRRLAAVVRSK